MEGELIACKNAGEKNSDKVALSSALLAKTKIELQDVIKERDNQMTALATLLAKGELLKKCWLVELDNHSAIISHIPNINHTYCSAT